MLTQIDLQHFKCFSLFKVTVAPVDAALRRQCIREIVCDAGPGSSASDDARA